MGYVVFIFLLWVLFRLARIATGYTAPGKVLRRKMSNGEIIEETILNSPPKRWEVWAARFTLGFVILFVAKMYQEVFMPNLFG